MNNDFRIENDIIRQNCRLKLYENLEVIERGNRLELNWMIEHYNVLRDMKEEFKRKKGEIIKALKVHGYET